MPDKTWVAGDVVTAADTNTYLTHTGEQWVSFTPTLYQSNTLSVSVTNTVTKARYFRAGRMIHFEIVLNVTATGTAGNLLGITLPVAAATTGVALNGSCLLYDVSAVLYYAALPQLFSGSTTIMTFVSTSAAASADPRLGVSTFTVALGNNDVIAVSGSYEAVS